MSIAFNTHFWCFDENRFNYNDADLSTHIYHPRQSSKIGSNSFREYRAKFVENRKQKLWRLPKTPNKLMDCMVDLNKLLSQFSISCSISKLDEQIILLSDGSLVFLTLCKNDPESINIIRNAVPGLKSGQEILSSSGSDENIVCILPRSRISVISLSGYTKAQSNIQQCEVANIPDMPDNACVQTRHTYSAIYWSERTEDGAIGQLLIINHAKETLEVASRVRFDSLIQKISHSQTRPNFMWCIEIPDPRTPSTMKLTCFLVKETGLSIFDAEDSKEFIVQLSSPVIQSAFSPNDEKILFGCSDHSVVIMDTKTKLLESVKSDIRPLFLAWHPLSHFFIVTSRGGDSVMFDVGLTQLEFVPIRENAESDGISILKMGKFYRPFTFIERIDWVTPTQCFIASNKSPLVLLNFPFGIFDQGALGLVKEHVRKKNYPPAIKVLYSINWNTSASIAYAALTTILDSLLVQPLNYNRETYIEHCLAAFYNPARPLSDLIVLEFRDHILRYARRFFHHLIRHRRLQKSFLLSIDIGAQDLFLDVHHMALHYKEFGLAADAAHKVDECMETDEYNTNDDESDQDQFGTIQRFIKHVQERVSRDSDRPRPSKERKETNTASTLRVKNFGFV